MTTLHTWSELALSKFERAVEMGMGGEDDSQLWNVLETCQLKESIEGKEGKLDHVRALRRN